MLTYCACAYCIRLCRPPGRFSCHSYSTRLYSCGKPLPLTFSHRASHPFSPDHRHLLSTLIITQLPPGNIVPDPCHRCIVANPFPWRYDWQVLWWMLVSANCWSELGCHVPWDPAVVQPSAWAWRWEEGTQTHTHIAWDHSVVQSVWGPYSGCQFCCDVSFMSPLCGRLLKCVDRGIIQPFDIFPYIQRLLITLVNASVVLWQVLRITTWGMSL